jgi:hypothetical protein
VVIVVRGQEDLVGLSKEDEREGEKKVCGEKQKETGEEGSAAIEAQ